jgi:hypothetical protein
VSGRGAKAAGRHQAVSGYWHSLATLACWCRILSYIDSALATASPPSAAHSREELVNWPCPAPALFRTRDA